MCRGKPSDLRRHIGCRLIRFNHQSYIHQYFLVYHLIQEKSLKHKTHARTGIHPENIQLFRLPAHV